MKYTHQLHVIEDPRIPEKTIKIHPNDGYDLGLMTYEYKLRIFANCTAEDFNKESCNFISGEVHQLNECRVGTISISPKYSKSLGNPDEVKLIAHEDKLLILNLPSLK